MTKIASMDKQMVTGHNPQADAQKTGKALKKGRLLGGQKFTQPAPSLFKSGWQMARIV
jgi:hypothetical protein